MKAKLLVVGGEAKAAEINLRLPTIIGRGREANLALPHPLVSRKHCEIYEEDGQLRVRDLGSLNGTYIADQRVTDATLPPGELLTVGTVTFRAVYGNEADFEDDETLPPTVDSETNGETMPQASETVPKPEPPDGDEASEQVSRVTSDTAWQPSPKEDPNSPSGNEEFGSFLNDQP
jgi:predicted component of type VI protein secretion system